MSMCIIAGRRVLVMTEQGNCPATVLGEVEDGIRVRIVGVDARGKAIVEQKTVSKDVLRPAEK